MQQFFFFWGGGLPLEQNLIKVEAAESYKFGSDQKS